MSDRRLTEDQARQVHEMKRSYWTQKGIGEEYQYCVHEPEPITRLKNVVEISFVTRHVTGPRILAAGAGTGRFSLPLSRNGLEVVPLDISLEMLGQGVERAAKISVPFPAVAGDIERLPFCDGTFDSVVSITVLRHFPGWRTILDEYARVLRPAGRIIFDMASGDQEAYLTEKGLSKADAPFDAQAYNAAVSMRELIELTQEAGLSIVVALPNDLFNENRVLERVWGDDLDAFLERARKLLDHDLVVVFYELLARRVFPLLSPAMTGSWMIVLEKQPGARPYDPPHRAVPPNDFPSDPGETLFSIFRACMGDQFDAFLREAAPHIASTEVRSFIAFLREEVLPKYPLETLYWEAGRAQSSTR